MCGANPSGRIPTKRGQCVRLTDVNLFHIVGGSTAFLIRQPATILPTPTHSFKSFEMSYVTLKLFSSNFTVDFKSLPSMFTNFFSNKVVKLHSTIKSHSTNTYFQLRHIPPNLTVFTPVSREELFKLISQSSNTFCDLDPIPTSILKQCLPILLPTIYNIHC